VDLPQLLVCKLIWRPLVDRIGRISVSLPYGQFFWPAQLLAGHAAKAACHSAF
jgi:hypothetical protein